MMLYPGLLVMLALTAGLLPAAEIGIPLVMRVEGQPVRTEGRLLLTAEVYDALLKGYDAAQAKGSKPLQWFVRFLDAAAGPASDKAAAMVSAKQGDSALPAKTLLEGYRRLLANPKRRILLSMERKEERLFFWAASRNDDTGLKLAVSVVRREGNDYKVAAPDSGDGVAYLILRGLQQPDFAAMAATLAPPPVASTKDLLLLEESVRLFLPGVEGNAEVELNCSGPAKSTPLNLVGCWLRELSGGGPALSWMSERGRSAARDWLASLTPRDRDQLGAMHRGNTFRGSVASFGPVAMVFPAQTTPALGNKRSVYVRTEGSTLSIVNFFSADFLDALLAPAIEKLATRDPR